MIDYANKENENKTLTFKENSNISLPLFEMQSDVTDQKHPKLKKCVTNLYIQRRNADNINLEIKDIKF